MSTNTQAYYEYRAAKARILAAAAIDPQIATIHTEMAERYKLLTGERSGRVPASVSEFRAAEL